MRDVKVIKKNRDKLLVVCAVIRDEMDRLERIYDGVVNMDKQISTHFFRLSSLRTHYMDQVFALNFVLNEDKNLLDYKNSRMYEGYEEFMFTQEE